MFQIISVAILMATLGVGQTSSISNRAPISDKARDRLIREVRHEIVTLPFFGVFDNIAFRVDGYAVTLMGQVTLPTLKSDVERAVKEIEGVERVDNKIEVLPLSPNDDRLRRMLFGAIYGYDGLQRYALPVIKPIRIIVKNGRATLEGVVANEMDKQLAYMRANGVPGLFAVTNNLQVEKK
jgi:hyperosmotically inducible periplasmic protein